MTTLTLKNDAGKGVNIMSEKIWGGYQIIISWKPLGSCVKFARVPQKPLSVIVSL